MLSFRAMNLTIHASISINSIPSKVWEALTDVQLCEKYLYNVLTKEGSSVNKTEILDSIPQRYLHTLYPKLSMGGQKTEYYHIIYELEADHQITKLNICQENIENTERAEEIKKAWDNFFAQMKKKLELANDRL
jgi:hypothetical protein